MREKVAAVIRRIRGEIHSWGSRILPPRVDKKRRRTHSWEGKTLPPGAGKRRSTLMDRADGCHHRGTWRNTLLGSRVLQPGCMELSEEHTARRADCS